MASGGDYARNWQVYVSSDGTSWGNAQIRQMTSAGTTSWWSIYDLNLYGP
jgi:hypothetical protein